LVKFGHNFNIKKMKKKKNTDSPWNWLPQTTNFQNLIEYQFNTQLVIQFREANLELPLKLHQINRLTWWSCIHSCHWCHCKLPHSQQKKMLNIKFYNLERNYNHVSKVLTSVGWVLEIAPNPHQWSRWFLGLLTADLEKTKEPVSNVYLSRVFKFSVCKCQITIYKTAGSLLVLSSEPPILWALKIYQNWWFSDSEMFKKPELADWR